MTPTLLYDRKKHERIDEKNLIPGWQMASVKDIKQVGAWQVEENEIK